MQTISTLVFCKMDIKPLQSQKSKWMWCAFSMVKVGDAVISSINFLRGGYQEAFIKLLKCQNCSIRGIQILTLSITDHRYILSMLLILFLLHRLGQVVNLKARVNRIFNTSMEVKFIHNTLKKYKTCLENSMDLHFSFILFRLK